MKKAIFLISCLSLLHFSSAYEDDRSYITDTWSEKDTWKEAAANHLVYSNVYGEVTPGEIEGIKKFFLAYDLPTHNGDNYYFPNRSFAYMAEWVYEKDGDISVLNRAIDVARRVIKYRHDNIDLVDPRYPQDTYIDFSRGTDRTARGAVWPNYKRKGEVEVEDRLYFAAGAGVFAGLPNVTVPVRMIANHPNIWENDYQGKTYREIADELRDEAFKTIDYTYDNLVGSDNLIKYTDNNVGGDWTGKVFIYNRVFPIISGSIPLVQALEIFCTNANKIARIDEVNSAMMAFFMDDFTWGTTNGKETCYYPYSDMAQSGNPDQAEDFNHGSFDGRDLQYIYQCGRYNYGRRYVEGVANTISEVVYVQDGVYTGRLNGKDGTTNTTNPRNFDGYVWYASFNPDLKKKLIDHVAENIVPKGERYDAPALFELLKIKERKFEPWDPDDPTGMVYKHEKNSKIVVSFDLKGNTLKLKLPESERIHSVSVYAFNGRLLRTKVIRAGNHSATLDCGNVSNGAYVIRLQTGGYGISRKMVLQK